MMFGPRLRKVILVAHVTASVGWLGAIVAYLPFDVIAATSSDVALLRVAYVAMHVIASQAIVPLAAFALASGIAVSLGTPWGLFRHYWVVVSLVLTTIAFLALLSETRTTALYASLASDPASTDAVVVGLTHTLPHSVGGLVVLTIVLVINMVKPRGLTPYGWRKQKTRA